jgi:hypothetical protein
MIKYDIFILILNTINTMYSPSSPQSTQGVMIRGIASRLYRIVSQPLFVAF